MPVLLKDYRVNDFSKRCTVYSKLKRITNTGFDTSNDLFAEGNFGRLQGLNDNSKDYFSGACADIIKFNGIYVACGFNYLTIDKRSVLSTFLYSEDNGVSWTFSNDTFESVNADAIALIVSDNTLFCSGSGTDDGGNYGLMSSTDGKTWTKVPSPFSEIDHIATNGSGEILASGWDINNINLITAVSSDNGGTWTQLSNTDYNIINSSTVTTYYANDRFYMGITTSNTLSLHTSQDLTLWSQVVLAAITNSGPAPINPQGTLNGVYYSSGTYILNLTSDYQTLGIPLVYYSTIGDFFYPSTGIVNINAVTNVTNVTYNTSDNCFYLSMQYSNTNSLSPDTYIMYKSTDSGQSWSGVTTVADLSSQLPSNSGSNIMGISQFYIDDYSIAFVIGATNDSINSSFGLVPISFSNNYTNLKPPIFLSGLRADKLLSTPDALLVGVYESERVLGNSIYYYSSTQRQLVPTEHQDDV